ncbi:unnamed protein product [Ambrosiozyma monospora]|uniref:Unnamed protein product n=1 Tax=Ambrosiozyma monospora TaxID=43982 RepID=A0ACB5TSM3_AMBMO|nr:unnamed protein product [Ambrosiozyma monospora]
MDYRFLTGALTENPLTKVQFWQFFKKNYPKFRGDVAMWTLDRVIKLFVPNLASEKLFTDVSGFFAGVDTNGYDKGLKQGLDSVKNSVAWAQRSHEDVGAWLTKNGY